MADISVNDVSRRLAVSVVPAATARPVATRTKPEEATTKQTDTASKRKPSTQQVQAARKIERPQRAGTKLLIDKNRKQIVAQILDQNNQVMDQIPPQEILDMEAKADEVNGKIFDQRI